MLHFEETILDLDEELAVEASEVGEVALDLREVILALGGFQRLPAVDHLRAANVGPAQQRTLRHQVIGIREEEVLRRRGVAPAAQHAEQETVQESCANRGAKKNAAQMRGVFSKQRPI